MTHPGRIVARILIASAPRQPGSAGIACAQRGAAGLMLLSKDLARLP